MSVNNVIRPQKFSKSHISRTTKNHFDLKRLNCSLTDTGEDSKLVHRENVQKWTRYYLLFFSDASERRV